MAKKHGGKRDGAGRPEGSKNARTHAVMEFLDSDDKNPVIKLVSIMNKAYELEDFRLSADCAKSLLPYFAPKPQLLEEESPDARIPILVNVNVPIPGQHWRNKSDKNAEKFIDDVYIDDDLIE